MNTSGRMDVNSSSMIVDSFFNSNIATVYICGCKYLLVILNRSMWDR